MKIIDCHCHLGRYFNFSVPGHSPEAMIKSMDNIGVEKSCISPHMSLTSDIKKGNAFMMETVIKYPERFIGFFTYNPHFPDLMKSELPIYFQTPGIKGVKIHQGTHKTTLKNQSYRNIYSFADKYNIPIMIHTWSMETIKNIEEISAEYSNAIFIMGHFGAIPDNMKYAAKVIKSRNNVYGDTTVSMMFEKNVEWLVEIAGEDKVLYGTDMPFIDPRVCLGRILYSDLTDSIKEKILSRTMETILENIKNYENL